MNRISEVAAFVLVAAGMGATSGALVTQSGLSELGLTETAARNFVLNDVKSPSSGRTSAIATAGNRAFLKLPPSARGPAATALFAWAKAYVNSPAFKTAYASFRRNAVPEATQHYDLTVDEEVKKKIDEQRDLIQRMRQMAATMAPADAAMLRKSADEQDAQIRSGELAKMLKAGYEADRAAKNANLDTSAKEANERYPADPEKIFARRLREFLDETAEANFSARTISLTGGPDGIEFIERADQKRSWLWQLAIIAGKEATTAARASAQAWLKELTR
jgi:hypothetical protein